MKWPVRARLLYSCGPAVRSVPRHNVPMRVVLLLLAAASLGAQNASDENSIRSLIEKYVDARESQKPGAVESLFTADADQLVSTGEWRKGRDEVGKGTLASSRNNQGKRTLTVASIRFVAPDVVIADCRYEISGIATRKMWSTFVVVRTKAGWRISAIRNMLPTK
jgi:uncharacterized protein (TIGR02246 family)